MMKNDDLLMKNDDLLTKNDDLTGNGTTDPTQHAAGQDPGEKSVTLKKR